MECVRARQQALRGGAKIVVANGTWQSTVTTPARLLTRSSPFCSAKRGNRRGARSMRQVKQLLRVLQDTLQTDSLRESLGMRVRVSLRWQRERRRDSARVVAVRVRRRRTEVEPKIAHKLFLKGGRNQRR